MYLISCIVSFERKLYSVAVDSEVQKSKYIQSYSYRKSHKTCLLKSLLMA